MQDFTPFSELGVTLRNSFMRLFKAVREREKGVIIASSQRCGTHLIGAYLRNTKIGTPGEHFLDYLNTRASGRCPEKLTEALSRIVVDGSGGAHDAFSLVLMGYTETIGEDLEAIGLSRSILSRSMKHLTWVWLRRDWAEVSVSHYFAVKTGAWESSAGDHAPPPFDAKEIYRWWRHIQATDAFWDRYFNESSIRPIQLDYAQLVQDPSVLADIVSRAGGDPSGLSTAAPPPRMPHAQCKQEYAARFRDYLAETRSGELFRLHSTARGLHGAA